MSASTTPEATPRLTLLRKLHAVAEAIDFVEKRGRNDHHKYDFVQAVDVIRDVRAQLLARKIVLLPEVLPDSLRHHVETGGKAFVTTADFRFTFVDTEDGGSVAITWAGAGSDTGGDKGIYKAMTGALKYALISAFLLPTTNDPEHDALSAPNAEAAVQPGGTTDKDADRPAAPRIPIDRAKLILEASKAAGLVNDDDSFSPVLKAKLADVGVTKIGQLDVDQAEEVEAFVNAEAKAGAEA